MTMHLSPHFTVDEFTASDTAARRSIDNHLPASMLVAAGQTCDMLERIRAHLSRAAGRDVPILLTSGYRCPSLNAAIGGAPASDHVFGRAVDFKAPSFGSAFEVASALAPHVVELGIGQLIHEFGAWVHVSTRVPPLPVNRIITISKAGTVAGIQEVA
jgi:zinc D-Ala-D-Ala carboxypeptidase